MRQRSDSGVVLHQPWGGLGDNLSFSTLPGLYSKRLIPFHVSHRNAYRNADIKGLVWDINPHVMGVSKRKPNIGRRTMPKIPLNNHIENIEAAYGFRDTGNKYPKIYYEPKIIRGLEDKTVLSLNSISVKYRGGTIGDALDEMLGDEDVLLLRFVKDLNNLDCGRFSGRKHQHKDYSYEATEYIVPDIFYHCDVIASCKRYITLLSGASVLASAIIAETKRRNTEVILTGEYIDKVLVDRRYYFDNLRYVR